jgi:hypothetical protein
MSTTIELDAVAAPRSTSRLGAWRTGLIAASVGVAGILVGVGGAQLADRSGDTSPATTVEPDAAPRVAVPSRAGDVGVTPEGAEPWRGAPGTSRPDIDDKFGPKW